jgi:hypothetical protein
MRRQEANVLPSSDAEERKQDHQKIRAESYGRRAS